MGAYDNPQGVRMKIDQGARNIAQFFTAMKGVGDNIAKQAAINKREAEKATLKKDREKREKEAREGRALSTFDKDYAHIESLIDQMGGDFDAGEGSKNIQDDAIMENLIAMRTKFLSEIADPDIGAAEISKIQAQFNNRIATFKEDMDNFIGGYRVYKDIKDRDLGPNEEDAILSDETAPFNEMIPIYESIYTKKGDVGIYPSADGNSFNIGRFNKGKRESEAGEVLTGSSLTEYRKYAQKNGINNPKFFEQVEVYAPGNGSRIDFVTSTMGKLKDTDYNIETVTSEPTMVKNKEGKLVPKMKVGKRPDPKNPTGPLIQVMVPVVNDKTILNAEKLQEFRNTEEGVNYLLSSLGGKNPKAVYAGLGYPPGTYTQDALLDAIVLDLEQTFNKSTILVDENIGSEQDTFENIDNTAGQSGYLS